MIYSLHTSNKIRLDEFLRIELPSLLDNKGDISNSKIRRLIISGQVSVNGKEIRRPAFELRGKSSVTINFDKDKFFYEKEPDDIKFTMSDEYILYEDDVLIIVNKPSMFPTEATIVGDKRDNLHDALVRFLWNRNPSLRNPPYVGIMHRLDRETSGAILFTKSRSVNKQISEMFSSHDFKKLYYALCEDRRGHYKVGDKFTVHKTIGRVSSKGEACKWGSLSECRGGLDSKTDFSVIESKNLNSTKCLLVEADLYTGRTHQIRVHLSEASLPIVGDTLYGASPSSRIHLHAHTLIFKHPVTNEVLTIKAPCPFL